MWLITCQYIDQWIDKHATMPHRHDISHMCEKKMTLSQSSFNTN